MTQKNWFRGEKCVIGEKRGYWNKLFNLFCVPMIFFGTQKKLFQWEKSHFFGAPEKQWFRPTSQKVVSFPWLFPISHFFSQISRIQCWKVLFTSKQWNIVLFNWLHAAVEIRHSNDGFFFSLSPPLSEKFCSNFMISRQHACLSKDNR